MISPKENEVRRFLGDYAFDHLRGWIPGQCHRPGGRIDWGQVDYLRNEAILEFVEWHIKSLNKGFNPEGSRDIPPWEWTNYWATLRSAVMMYYDYECYICKRYAGEIHHVCPRQFGGTDHPSNLVPLCMKCHHKVHQRLNSYLKFAFASAIDGIDCLDYREDEEP